MSRPLRGTAAELIAHSHLGLTHMQTEPERSFRCGPLALMRILTYKEGRPTQQQLQALEESYSTPVGLSLTAVAAMSAKADMNYQMAYRERGAHLVFPAVAHWKVGHYAAIVGQDDGRYVVQDSTFGEDILVRPGTIEEEASGYFLVPPGVLPPGWRSVTASEGETVFGRGDTGTAKDKGATGAGSGNPAFPRQGSPGGSCPGGCTTWNVEPSVTGLSLQDTPVRYAPPVGPAILFSLTYSHRDVQQPQTFTYVNHGPKWTNNWVSYVVDNLNVNRTADLYLRGGGDEIFTFASGAATASGPGPFSQSVITRSVDGAGKTMGFVRTMRDGSTEEFGKPLGTKFFMTAWSDAHGNRVKIAYDAQMRITGITDAIGQVTTLSYSLTADPLKITKVTDPFGRTASFSYNTSGQLASITDSIGITSSFTYGSGDFVSMLETPYGKSTFSYGDSTTNSSLGSTRFVMATDALGRTSRVEFNQDRGGIPNGVASALVPKGMSTLNQYLNYRNTFIWNPLQYQQATSGGGLDYSKAKLIHWLHTLDGSTARVIESQKEPLQNRIWYDYPGQPNSIRVGTINRPLHAGVVLADGTTQLTTYTYDAFGNLTSQKDPVGRTTTYQYASNGIDLISVANTTDGVNEVLATFTYDDKHNVLTAAGVDGATTTYQYNTMGQVTKATNALNESTTYARDTNGYLTQVQGAVAAAKYAYTYDSIGRVATATDPGGATVSYAYDDADRRTTTTFPDGTKTTFRYKLLDLATTTDRLGHVTTLTYDAERQLVQISDPLKQAINLGYSPDGRLQLITDGNNHDTKFTLDTQGRVTQKTYADGTAQLVAYDGVTNRVIKLTDAKGQTTTYAYNLDDTVASITYSNATTATAPVSFAYDSKYRRPLSMTDGTGTTSYSYYPVTNALNAGANRLQKVVSPVAGTAITDTVSYSYDVLGRRVGRSVNGANETTAFDGIGRVTGITNALDAFSYSYGDGTSRVTAIASVNGPKVAMEYFDVKGDELLKKLSYTTASGSELSSYGYSYDANHNVTSFTESYVGQKFAAAAAVLSSDNGLTGLIVNAVLKAPGGSVGPGNDASSSSSAALSATNVFLLTLAGLLTMVCAQAARQFKLRRLWPAIPVATVMALTSCSGGGGGGGSQPAPAPPPPAPATASAEVTNYAYDAANRLISAAVGTNIAPPAATNPKYSFGYDAASNITSIGGASLSYSATNAIVGTTYDANGSPTVQGVWTYSWDAANRIIYATNGTSESSFSYDGQSRLVRIVDKKSGAIVSDKAYLWCGMTRCQERDNAKTNSPVSKQYFSQGTVADGQPLYYALDLLGSVRQLLDTSGKVQAQYAFDPYGARTRISGDTSFELGFTGLFDHGATGLGFAIFRAYDKQLARWINRDPIGERGGLNLYAYVNGNPLGYRDPHGTNAIAGAEAGAELGSVFGPVGTAAGCVIGAGVGAYLGDLLSSHILNATNSSEDSAPKPPSGSKGIDETPWSGDHGEIKDSLGLGGKDKVKISPDGNVWVENPDGTWADKGPASDYTASGKPSGRRGKDRDTRGGGW